MANVLEIAKRARAAALELSGVSEERKNAALARIAELLEQEAENIIAANSRDLEKAAAAGLSKPMLERLSLDRKKIAGIAEGVRQVAALPDPVGEIIEKLLHFSFIFQRAVPVCPRLFVIVRRIDMEC